jgi:tetratricopeptide (TPR) repeat protein
VQSPAPARASDISSEEPEITSEPPPDEETSPVTQRARGIEYLRANAFAEAIELLSQAVIVEPQDASTQLHLGIALQGARLDAQALTCFASVQKLLPNDAAAFLHAAVSLLNLGKPAEALQAASDACWRAPQLAQAHYTYGQAWLASDAPAEAERAFAEAIRRAPAWAEAWVNYGVARYRQGAIEDAKTAMRRALVHAPGHVAATTNLGAFMRISGESEAATNLLRGIIARQPQNSGARLNLAADYLQDERGADALALLDAVEPPADNRALRHWYLQKSQALLQLRRADEARAVLDQLAALGPLPSEIAPLWHWRQILLARLEGDAARARKAAAQMESSLETMGPDGVLEHRIMAHYDLAKFWSGQNVPTRAFRHWRSGHALLKLSQPFSRDEYRTFVDANIAAFDRDRLAQGPRARKRDAAPVFIVGMPRSGTILCEQILAAHAQAHGAGERSTLPRAFRALGGSPVQADGVHAIAALDADALDEAAARYLADLRALAPDKTRIVDKLPGNFAYLGLAGVMLPGAKIIHCVRDPRDIGLSIFTFRFHGAHGYAHDLRDLGWYIGQYDRLMAHWKTVLPGRILTVRLSDWVADFDGTLARVLAHVELPHDPNCARFYESESRVRTVSYAQVRQPINARGLGRWRAYERQLAPLIKELERAGSLDGWCDPPLFVSQET